MLSVPNLENPGTSSGSERRAVLSFEQNLKDRSAEFEAERLKATKPSDQDVAPQATMPPVQDVAPPPPAAVHEQQIVARVDEIEPELPEEPELPDDFPGKIKALAKRKASGGKAKPFYDPYAGMYYDPYVYSVKGKNKMLAVKGDWADAVDGESEWWYSGVKLNVCCKGSLNVRVRAVGLLWSGSVLVVLCCLVCWLVFLVFLFAVFCGRRVG